jgi:hypothetical protein
MKLIPSRPTPAIKTRAATTKAIPRSRIDGRHIAKPQRTSTTTTISFLISRSRRRVRFYCPSVVAKWRYRVRLNGADHQWGKDPPKEVVG